MGKRKISDYYKSTKKRARRVGGTKTRISYAKGRKNYRRKGQRMGRRTRGGRRKKGSRTKTITGNLRTLTQSIADRVTVPSPVGTAGTTDAFGKKCAYLFSGVKTGTDYSLGCMTHVINMAALIENDEQSLYITGATSETKFVIKDANAKYDFVNMSNGSAKLTIYTCVCQRDIINGQLSTNFISILGDGFYQRGLTAGGRGLSDQGVYDASLTPFDSHKFCSYFKVLKSEICVMDPGSMQTRTIKTGRQQINMEHYTTQSATAQNSLQAGLDYSHRRGQKFLFIKVEGQPANDNGNETTRDLSYTTPAIDMITEVSYTFQAVNRQAPIIAQMTSVGFGVPAASGVQLMEDETGNVVNQVNA